MKKYPYPDKPLRSKATVKEYICELISGCSNILEITGYRFIVSFPGDEEFAEHGEGMSIVVNYPYKKYILSVQKKQLDDLLTAKRDASVFHNIELSIFHELIHVVLWPFGELGGRRFVSGREFEEAEETVTDHISHAIHELVKDNRELVKKKLKK